MDDLRGEIQELFADLWQVSRLPGMRAGFRPDCDCFRTDDPPAVHVVVELPGVARDSVRLAITGSTLVISGSRARPRVSGARYQMMEIDYGPFERRLELADDIDAEAAEITHEDGVLTIVLPVRGDR